MKRFFKYFKGYVLETILSPLFKMLEAVSELCVPLLVAKIIDEGLQNKTLKKVYGKYNLGVYDGRKEKEGAFKSLFGLGY